MMKRVSLVLLSVVLLLSACNGGAKATPSAPASCLNGQWLLSGDEAFALTLLPPGAFEPKDLSFRDADGLLTYTFDAKGVVTVRAQWVANFDVKLDQEILALQLQINGQGAGNYQESGDQVTVNTLLPSVINYIAGFKELEMVNSVKMEEFAPLFVSGYRTARFTCDADNLSLQILNQPNAEQPITLVRVKPAE